MNLATLRLACLYILSLVLAQHFAQPAIAQDPAPSAHTRPTTNAAPTVNVVPKVATEKAIKIGVQQLLEIQNEDGSWPYEGVYRVNRKIPVGYRIGGTAICCEALLYATPADHEKANEAIRRGVKLILSELDDPRMKPVKPDRYDVRIWGHIYALDLFGRITAASQTVDEDAEADTGRFSDLAKEIQPKIKQLTDAILLQQSPGGGWNYANGRSHAGFVTAPAIQALLWARHCGQEVPKSAFQNAANALMKSRTKNVAFSYSGIAKQNRPAPIQSSVARSANCEATLSLMGFRRGPSIKYSVAQFHQHWEELEKRRKKTGTHKPPFGIAPYYFYYAHRYTAFAITCLPKEQQAAEFELLQKTILRTRDEDGTWNDRVFDRSRAYGTAMAILGLLEDTVPLPHNLQKPLHIDLLNPNKDAHLPEAIHIAIPPELLQADFMLSVSEDGTVTVGKVTMPLDELQQWLSKKQFDPPPTVIVIEAHGQCKTKDVEIVKRAINETKALLGGAIYVGVKNNEK